MPALPEAERSLATLQSALLEGLLGRGGKAPTLLLSDLS